MKELKRSKTLTELVAERLRNAIINNEFMLGEPLSESLLAKSMGTSKTPVREALAQLKNEGLVIILPQKGTFVFTLSLKEVNDLVELRFILESAALKLAYTRSRDALIESLGQTLVNMQNALGINDVSEYLRFDAIFHESFFVFCDNKYLFDAYVQISAKAAALRTRISHQPNHPQKTYREHEEIFYSIRKDDTEQAVNVLQLHFSSFEKFYVKYSHEIDVSDMSSTRKKLQSNKDLP